LREKAAVIVAIAQATAAAKMKFENLNSKPSYGVLPRLFQCFFAAEIATMIARPKAALPG